MSIQKTSVPVHQSSTDAALSGNKSADAMAKSARKVIEDLMQPAMTPKLSELPTKRERLHAVADAIERQELVKQGIGFNMGVWKDRGVQDKTGNRCGTAACISGWATLLEHGAEYDGFFGRGVGQEILGLNYAEARALFIGMGIEDNHLVNLSDVTPQQAVSVLRHFADKNEVRWDLFDNQGKRKS